MHTLTNDYGPLYIIPAVSLIRLWFVVINMLLLFRLSELVELLIDCLCVSVSQSVCQAKDEF